MIEDKIKKLRDQIDGEVLLSKTDLILYATDASAYQEMPLAVIIPRSEKDIHRIILFANEHNVSIIPRAAGTSLAGQVVGEGIVVDTSKYLTTILEVNAEEKWVRVQPGIVLDELNMHLKAYGLYFGPETSASNRCMIGGMVGNNACGAHSLIYGSTRDHTLELHGFLSDGSEVQFKTLSKSEFLQKCKLETLEGEIYRNIESTLSDPANRKRISAEFPDPGIKRRNTGYAIDLLMDTEPFVDSGKPFNFCNLICGSEGTLMFVTEIKLNLVDLPPSDKGLLVVHHKSIAEALKANLITLKHHPSAVELIDNIILECTKSSFKHSQNFFFIKGDPGALLCVEFIHESRKEISRNAKDLITDLKRAGLGYEFPLLFDTDIDKVWALRKAGLGLLSNIPGDDQPVSVIEDTAVHPEVLPEYINDFNAVLKEEGLNCVFYAHAGTGELHLRPIINLKTKEGVKQFHTIALEIAKLVKTYRGSLSGEHGDGRLRGEFIPFMIGEENYQLLRKIKRTWDPYGALNSGKITDAPPMHINLRYKPGQETPEFKTIFDFSESHGFLRLAEKCTGSADCRKSALIGGTMCPSYQATRDEDKTTRARANILRSILTKSKKTNPFNDKELYGILDLCLSCKGCKSECPSGVDMAKLKAEFLYHYYKSNLPSFRTFLIANFSKLQAFASQIGKVYNALLNSKLFANALKRSIGFAVERSLPSVYRQTLRKWLKKNLKPLNEKLNRPVGAVYLFVDEFTNYNDVNVGTDSVRLLNKLGYIIHTVSNADSGRPYLSKGFLKKARKLAERNIEIFASLISKEIPLVGIEPSAILTFRDEYPDLLRGEKKKAALALAENTYTIEEFIVREVVKGKITQGKFTSRAAKIILHGHCQQKAISSTDATKACLSLPINYEVEEIKSGCCGMAGSFGYEKEHYDLSMKIGELVLFPSVRQAEENTIVVAPGTSCRHQIKDGTGKIAKHPVEVLFEALKQ